MGRQVNLLCSDGKIYTYSEDNLDSLKEAISGVIEQHKKQLFDIRLLGGIIGKEPLRGPEANTLRKSADKILVDLRKKLLEAADSLPKK